MAFQPVPDAVEINVIYDQSGEVVQNVFYAEIPGGYSLVDLQLLADVMDAQIQGTWKTQQSTDATYLRIEVRGLAAINDLFASNNDNTGPGVGVGGSLPNQVTLAIKKASALTGRSARGRCYWIGVLRAQLTVASDNEFEAAYVAAVVAAVDSIRTSIDGTPLWVPVLVSRFSGGLPRSQGVTFPWVSTLSVDNTADTQRGRLPS